MSPPPPSRPPGLIDLPTELVGLIASHLDLDRDLSALCRAHRRLDRILSRTLYQRHAPLALVAGVVVGNTATVQKALDLCSGPLFSASAIAAGEGSLVGGDVMEMVFPVDDARRLSAAARTRRPCDDDDDDEGNCLDEYDEDEQTCRGKFPSLTLGHYTALAFAVMCNQAEVVRVLLEHLAQRRRQEEEEDQGSGQETTTTTTTTTAIKAHIRRSWALHLACQFGHVAVVSLLLERTGGGSVVVCDRGHTRGGNNWYEQMRAPLSLAVGWERAAVVELLLNAGGGILLADKQQGEGKGNDDDDEDDDDEVQLGPEAEAELVPQLIGTSQAFCEMVVPRLVAHGLRVHEWRDPEAGDSGSLAWYCLEDLQLDKLEFLIDTGLVTGGGWHGARSIPALPRPALHVAARDGRLDLVRRLLDLGAQPADPLTPADAERLVSTIIEPGLTPLHCALLASREQVFDVLQALLLAHDAGPAHTQDTSTGINVHSDGDMPLLLLHLNATEHWCARDDYMSDAAVEGDNETTARQRRCTASLRLLLAAPGAETATAVTCGWDRGVLEYAETSGCYGCIREVFATVGYERALAFVTRRRHGGIERPTALCLDPWISAWRDEFGDRWDAGSGKEG